MLTTLFTCGILLFSCVTYAPAQEVAESPPVQIEDQLPNDVLTKLKSVEQVRKVFPVSNAERFSGQVLRADEIVFSDGGNLILESIELPWILIVAKKLKFQNPEKYSKILLVPRQNLDVAPSGQKGNNGAAGNGRKSRDGKPGEHGADGNPGYKGKTLQLPHIYIVADEVISPNGVPPFLNFAIIANGVDGGKGGRGGNGGNGGNGYSGLKAASGLVDCKRGAGDGGRGGNAGRGGRGGDGGSGGNGASVTVISSKSGAELLSYARLFNVGGMSGLSGGAGEPGKPGEGGGMGHGDGYCDGGNSGVRGTIPNPNNLGSGINGVEGRKGEFKIVVPSNLSSVL